MLRKNHYEERIKKLQEITVRSYEGSQTLSFFQANKLACCSSLDDGRRHDTPGLEMKHSLLLTETAAFPHCFPELQVPQGDTQRAR